MIADKQAYIYPQLPMTVFVIWLRKVTEKIEGNTAKHRVNKVRGHYCFSFEIIRLRSTLQYALSFIMSELCQDSLSGLIHT